MSTAGSVITSARYDLRDTDETQYSGSELLDYLKRAIKVLDAELAGLNSDWVETQTTISLSTTASTVTQPSHAHSIRTLWIDDDEIRKRDLDVIRRKRQLIDSAGQPDYYANQGTSIIFERKSNGSYTITAHINQYTPALASSNTTMPFNGEFDDSLRQAVVILAENRQKRDLNASAVLHDVFQSATMKSVIKRNHVKKDYYLGF